MTTDNMQEETPSTRPAEPIPAEPVKKKRTGLIVSLVVAGVLLVGGGTAFYFVKASQADEKEQTANITGQAETRRGKGENVTCLLKQPPRPIRFQFSHSIYPAG